MNFASLRARASERTPTCTSKWVSLSTSDRLALIQKVIDENSFYSDTIILNDAAENGFVTIDFKRVVVPNERGGLLLGFEQNLKQSIDHALTVWLKPLGDRSSLRNLRGIEVKND